MPEIRSPALGNARFLDRIAVIRRIENVTGTGRSKPYTQIFSPVRACVTQGAAALSRADDKDLVDRVLTVVTRFRLRGVSSGAKPDIIIWPFVNGNQYEVTDSQDYSNWGSGWVQATCTAIEATETPPQGAVSAVPAIGVTDFSDPLNAGLAGVV